MRQSSSIEWWEVYVIKIGTENYLKGILGKSVGECKSAKFWGEMVKELSDGVTETQILQKLWKK